MQSDHASAPPSDEPVVLAAAGNKCPAVNAGPDQVVASGMVATLDGTVTDDGLPTPPARVTTTWLYVSGPGKVTFADAAAADTTATFSNKGIYWLRLKATDGALSNGDTLKITINSGVVNKPPTVSAGPDRVVTLPASASLDGTLTDDAQPKPVALTAQWSKVSGPGTVTFANSAAVDTTATFSEIGTYQLMLTGCDGVATKTDTVQVIARTGGTTGADDLVFIHHSVGQDWLDRGLHAALVAKSYIDERNDITYGTHVAQDTGRPASLGYVPGDSTDMRHWVPWFNDYIAHAKTFDCATGVNRIIMFKSCYPNSDIYDDGTEPGDPFGDQTLANYKAIFRHPSGSGSSYSHDGYTYKALEDIFAANPDTLFIPVTAPPQCNSDQPSNASAHRARVFNNWLKNTWLPAYNAAHPTLHNVAVFDLFNVLANPDSGVSPNRLKAAYGGTTGNSHPNSAGDTAATQAFATSATNFIDAAWAAFPH